MTQDEYNALTDEEQNALVATEVLGFEPDSMGFHYVYPKDNSNALVYFNPKHNLDHAFMLVDKLKKEKFALEWIDGIRWWACFILDSDIEAEWYSAKGDTLNEAIMLACLRAKGVVE